MRAHIAIGAGAAIVGLSMAGCGGGNSNSLSHRFDPVEVEPYGEVSWDCQSWTLHNEEPLYVNTVRQRNQGSWHHSNWFFVPEDSYAGPDGTWDCDSRGFSEVGAAVAGGVLFAQSTQVEAEKQQFRPGAAYKIPPHSKIVGNIHLLNQSEQRVRSSMKLTLETIPEEQVDIRLAPMGLFNRAIELPPRSDSHFTMECQFDQPVDFDVHYVLPHYHDLGTMIRLEVMGGERDGEVIFETQRGAGEPLGKRLDPDFDMAGATGLRFTCGYSNPRNEEVVWGIGDQEMCVALAYLDSDTAYGAFADEGTNERVGMQDGVSLNEAPCDLQAFPR